jgi:hypothetical protein
MRRREFLAFATALVSASTRVPLLAQSRPRIMLFGMMLVTKNPRGGITAVLPPMPKHAAFISGTDQTINGLANGNPVADGPKSNIGEGHPELGLKGSKLMCLHGDVTVGSGAATMNPGLANHLPNLLTVAQSIQPGSYSLAPNMQGTRVVSLNGGTLQMSQKPSTNTGTHGVDWQFRANKVPVGNKYKLIDVLEFEASGNSIDVMIGKGKPVTLSSGEQLWFINMPIEQATDSTVDVIEHADEWLHFVTPRPKVAVDAYAPGASPRIKGKYPLVHPCAKSRPGAGYFPPDTDPCFIAMA